MAEKELRAAVIDRVAHDSSHPDVYGRLDRARGCLLGGAIGDALGAPVEFLPRDQILGTFGTSGLRDFAPAYGKLGAVTDDTQMSLFTAEGLLRAHVRTCLRGIGPAFAAVVDRAYSRWLHTQKAGKSPVLADDRHENGWLMSNVDLFARRGPGITCLTALESKRNPGEPARNESKGCGGVMRMAPVGLFFSASSAKCSGVAFDEEAFDLACELAALTHGHLTGQLPAGYIAVLVAALVSRDSWAEATDRAWKQLVRRRDHEETSSLVARALDAASRQPSSQEALADLGEGWTAEEALAMGLYCAASAVNLGEVSEFAMREALLLAINHSGDSDSTGSIAGNILGAAWGSTSLPQAWVNRVELSNVLHDVADDLTTFPWWRLSEYVETPEGDYWSSRYPGD